MRVKRWHYGELPGSTLDLPIRSAITVVPRGAPPTLPNNADRPGTRKSTYPQSGLNANTPVNVSHATVYAVGHVPRGL